MMELPALHNSHRFTIGRKFVIYTLLFSSVITLFITIFQLYVDYRRDISTIEQRLEEIQISFQDSLATALWTQNLAGLNLHLEGILRLPDIHYIELVEVGGGKQITAGSLSEEQIIRYNFPLYSIYHPQQLPLGKVEIHADLNGVYQRLIDKAWVILMTQTFKTFIVSLFILWLLYMMLGRHLRKIITYTEAISFDKDNGPLKIERNRLEEDSRDEISNLIYAINIMRHRLGSHYIRMQQGEERYRLIADFTTDWDSWVTPEGQWAYISPSCEKVTGYSAHELQDAPELNISILHPDDRAAFHNHLNSYGDEHQDSAQMQFRIRDRNGKERWIEHSCQPVYSQQNTYLGRRASNRDITQNKYIEIALNQALEHAELANRTQSLFLANISHEIRTPMNAIVGLAHLLLEDHLTPKQKEYLLDIKRSTHSLLRILNDILDFSKIHAKKMQLDLQPTNIYTLIQNSEHLFTPLLKKKGLSLKIKINDNVNDYWLLDSLRVSQIINNLFDNAAKFTEKGGIIFDLSATKESTESHRLHFQICDSGIGIEPEMMSHLFRPFTQADSSISRKFGGSGLGLSIIASLIKMMQGEITVASTPDKGTCFQFSILASLSQKIAASPPSVPTVISSEERQLLSQKRVLLVDDNTLNRKVAIAMLQELNIKPDTASNGIEALNRVAETAYDMILMDIQMPQMGGLEANRAIRALQQTQAPLIIAMSASNSEINTDENSEDQWDDILDKPIDPDMLNKLMLKNLLGSELLPNKILPANESKGRPESNANINLEGLRERLHNNEEILLQILNDFYHQYRDFNQQATTLMSRGDLKSLRRLVHNLKGGSAYLGATRLNTLSAELDALLRENHPIELSLSPLKIELAQVLDTITPLIGDESHKERENNDAIDFQSLQKLLPYLQKNELIPENLLADLNNNQETINNASLAQLLIHIEHFEYHRAFALCHALLQPSDGIDAKK